jgi:hypothetical protein
MTCRAPKVSCPPHVSPSASPLSLPPIPQSCLISTCLANHLSIPDFDDFDDEPDPDLGINKDSSQTKKVAYDITFKVYEPRDIQKQQDDLIDEVNMILEMRKEDAAILLRYFRWNKERLIEDYMDSPNKVLEAAGLGPSPTGPPRATSAVRMKKV